MYLKREIGILGTRTGYFQVRENGSYMTEPSLKGDWGPLRCARSLPPKALLGSEKSTENKINNIIDNAN